MTGNNQDAFLFGVEFAMFTLAQVLFQTPIGAASDRRGHRPFILTGLLLFVPSMLAQGLVVVPWQMIAVRFVQGIAGAMMFTPSFALAGDYAGRGQSGTTLSVLTMASGLGTAIGPLSAGYLVSFGYVVPFTVGPRSRRSASSSSTHRLLTRQAPDQKASTARTRRPPNRIEPTAVGREPNGRRSNPDCNGRSALCSVNPAGIPGHRSQHR